MFIPTLLIALYLRNLPVVFGGHSGVARAPSGQRTGAWPLCMGDGELARMSSSRRLPPMDLVTVVTVGGAS